MSLSGFVSESKERISKVREGISNIIGEDEEVLIEEKSRLEDRINKLPISSSEWTTFSNLLDKEKHETAEKKVKNKFGWSQTVINEAAVIYANMTYYQSGINVSEAESEIYNSAQSMRSLEEQLNKENPEKENIAEKFNSAHKSLKKALLEIKRSEKETDRSRTATNYFEISGDLSENLNKQEKRINKLRKEIKDINKHISEKRKELT